MDFQEIDRRLATVERALKRHGITVEESLANVRQSPSATCVQCGVIVEHMLRDLWKRVGLKGSPERRQLEDLVTLTTRKLEDDGTPMPASVLNTIRQIQGLRNQAAHHWDLKTEDAVYCLAKLADVAQWYFVEFLAEDEATPPLPGAAPVVLPSPEPAPAPEPELLLIAEPAAIADAPAPAAQAAPAVVDPPPTSAETAAAEPSPSVVPAPQPRRDVWLLSAALLLALSVLVCDLWASFSESGLGMVILILAVCPLSVFVIVKSVLRKARSGVILGILPLVATLFFLADNMVLGLSLASAQSLLTVNATLLLAPVALLAFLTMRFANALPAHRSWDRVPRRAPGRRELWGVFLLVAAVLLVVALCIWVITAVATGLPDIAVGFLLAIGVLGLVVVGLSLALHAGSGVVLGMLPLLGVIMGILLATAMTFNVPQTETLVQWISIVVLVPASYLGYRTIQAARAISSRAEGQSQLPATRPPGLRFLLITTILLLVCGIATLAFFVFAEDLALSRGLLVVTCLLGLFVFTASLVKRSPWGVALGLLPALGVTLTLIYENYITIHYYDMPRFVRTNCILGLLLATYPAYRAIRFALAASQRSPAADSPENAPAL